jgi:hypothetical protein
MNHIEPSPVDHVHFQNSEGSTCQTSPITLPSQSGIGNQINLSTAGIAFEQSDDGVQLSVPATQSTELLPTLMKEVMVWATTLMEK